MSHAKDLICIGTGVAPLLAAAQALEEGRSVWILNPDRDFFRENSELPIDPFYFSETDFNGLALRARQSDAETIHDKLKPYFPGSFDLVAGEDSYASATSAAAAVRSRSRLWATRDRAQAEDLALHLQEQDVHFQLAEGVRALRYFPGISSRIFSAKHFEETEDYTGILMHRLADIDVDRYRLGLLEFMREKLGSEGVFTGVSQLKVEGRDLDFHSPTQGSHKVEFGEIRIFYTPQLESWIDSFAGTLSRHTQWRSFKNLFQPCFWEKWSLISRDPVDQAWVGQFDGMVVWSENRSISVLHKTENHNSAIPWVSQDSFKNIGNLCHHLLKWERFSLRGVSVYSTLYRSPIGSTHRSPIGSTHRSPIGSTHRSPIGSTHRSPIGSTHRSPKDSSTARLRLRDAISIEGQSSGFLGDIYDAVCGGEP